MVKLQTITRIADLIVFICTTLAITGVFYEGMTLKWYGFVGILVICMDYTFMPATVLHLIADKKDRRIIPHVLSLLMIAAAVIMKIAGIAYPAVTLVLWYFYIWFLYGSLIVRRIIRADKENLNEKVV
ncbi:MAG: hypothetical protein J5722_01035 [Oscillospiraceae bacterium]|nr:hypothetical protein [Oscillospiraceae bacterium]